MKGIFCCRSSRGIVFLAKNDSQSLFSVGNTILAFDGKNSSLVEIIEGINEAGIEDELKACYTEKKTELFIGRYKKRSFRLSKLQLGRYPAQHPVDDLGFILPSGKTVSSRLQRQLDSGFRLSSSSRLEDMLEILYGISDGDAHNPQFGFIDKYGAKTLFSPETEFSIPPQEYKKRGKFNHAVLKSNAGFYELLLRSLEFEETLKRGQHELDKGSSILQGLRKARIKSRISRTSESTGEIIYRYLDYRHGLLERFTLGSFIDDMSSELRRDTVTNAYHSKKHWTMQQRIDRELMPSGSRSLIISMKRFGSYSRRAQDGAHNLEKETGMMVRPLINFPYLVVRGSERDARKLYSVVKSGKLGKFSRRCSVLLSGTRNIAYAHGVYIPEIVAEFLSHGKSPKVVPIRARHRQVLWNLVNIGADKANSTTTGQGVSVAVCDTGIDYEHHELRDRFGTNKGYDFIENTNDPMDRQYHGTHVAGTIAGMSTGVAPDCTLYAVRVLDENGRGSLDGILLGVDWCITNSVDVANFSLGSAADSPMEYDVFRQAYEKGLICVAAAGNDYFGPSYPASYDCVIAVAAVDRNNDHADFSNIYHTNNVSAPGVKIYSSMPSGQYGMLSGTSMATPHIVGSAALVRSMRSGTGKDRFQKIIEETCLELGNPNDPDYWARFGCGLVQADKAVSYRGAGWMRRLTA